ncbi:hypothetical protein AX16_002213 [Volvariella volvacea WC 439]|nr:hypothetical protein AX16_002213 [Volvariella volvacea WC 439]
MLLASLFLAAFAHTLASPVPIAVPGSNIPSPICIVAATMTASQCDPTRTRTIFDILYSCIGVILLCTYISMHHNIPDQDDSWVKATWMKIRTTLYALVAPEMVIMWAIRQRMMAGRIAKENKHRQWTRTHGFFVQMGGLIQRQSDLTYRVLLDVQSAEIPHIPEKEIKDRGKGDLLAKAIVVLQTTWFVAQCVARHVEGLVLTEIELVTLAFATLNVITYALWWDKPLNVGYPIYFDDKGIRIDGPQETVTGDGSEKDEDIQVKEWKGTWYERMWRSMKDCIVGWNTGRQDIWESVKQGWRESVSDYGKWAVVVAPFVAVFFPLAEMAFDGNSENRPTSVHPFYAAEMGVEDNYFATLYGSVIGIVFGAIHVIGWDFQFSMLIELWLWRASSLVLTILPLILAVAISLLIAHDRTQIKILEVISFALIYPTAFLGPPLYFGARVVLLFLAFFTLRALPSSAYQNVRWTDFFPHI